MCPSNYATSVRDQAQAIFQRALDDLCSFDEARRRMHGFGYLFDSVIPTERHWRARLYSREQLERRWLQAAIEGVGRIVPAHADGNN